MINHRFSLLFVGSFLTVATYSQKVTSNNYVKVVVQSGEEKVIAEDTLYIDTLILKDGAKIKFVQHSVLTVNHAFVGKKCELNARGEDAPNARDHEAEEGGDGKDGWNLMMLINFKTLGSLTINTSGGNGGKGMRGKAGANGPPGFGGDDGSAGGNGGDGGNAGKLTLLYACDGFIPVFNGNLNYRTWENQGPKAKRFISLDHSIQLSYAGGKAGSGGDGGRGGRGGEQVDHTETADGGKRYITVVDTPRGRDGRTGKDGSSGKVGNDGELILRRRD